MAFKNLLAVAVAAGALFGGTSAHALVTVTLDPQANNGGLGVVDATEAAFNSTGFLGSLNSTLTISGLGAGVKTVVETGRLAVSDFQLNNANLNTNVASNYNIFADFTLTGFGTWSGNVFQASNLGAALTMTLCADTNADNTCDFLLGTGSLSATDPVIALAAIFPPTTAAFSSFTATIDFTPNAGTTGVGGFFRAPTPFSVNIAAGNVGGNLADTTFAVDGVTGAVTLTTTGGSGNFDFVKKVPEPSGVLLAGLALVAAGVASRRRSQAAA